MRSAPNFGTRWPRWMFITAVLMALPLASRAQKVSDQEVKAAYLYSFAKFVDWPAGAFSNGGAAIRICLFSGDPLEPNLKEIVRGKSVANHPVMVVDVQSPEESRTCHVLFVGAAQDGHRRQILEVLRGAWVLTVGDAPEFTSDGGIIQFVLYKDRIQFEVNHKAALDAQLNVSSRLLRVARTVIE